jgi:hypothetical protein
MVDVGEQAGQPADDPAGQDRVADRVGDGHPGGAADQEVAALHHGPESRRRVR